MTDTRIIHSTSPVDSLIMASADQDTILGNGTANDPLRAASASTGFSFTASVSNHAPVLGYAVSAAPLLSGHTRVTPGDARAVGGPGKQICGFITEILGLPFEDARIQCGGLVTLTEDEWDVVTDGSGGLSTGSAYYLVAPPGTSGNITTTPPAGSGEFVVLVGVALNTTTLLATSVPSVVLQNP